jgi:hypothetical protein
MPKIMFAVAKTRTARGCAGRPCRRLHDGGTVPDRLLRQVTAAQVISAAPWRMTRIARGHGLAAARLYRVRDETRSYAAALGLIPAPAAEEHLGKLLAQCIGPGTQRLGRERNRADRGIVGAASAGAVLT